MGCRIPIYRPSLTKEDIESVAKALEEGQLSGRAPIVNEFEKSFAAFLGLKYAIAVSSGTSALHVAFSACGLSRRDHIVQPSLTMMSTAFSASYVGAMILPVDVERSYWCIDPELARRAFRHKPRALVAVHLYGNPARVDELSEMTRKRDAYLIEDCAEALGTRLKGKLVGSFGDIATFSFFPNKLITTGEGGMIATNNEEIADQARQLRDLCFGKENKFIHTGIGYNYRMSAIQAALGLSQLSRTDNLIRGKRAVADMYSRELNGTPGLQLHPERPGSFSLPWMYSILVKKPRSGDVRNQLIMALSDAGIETRPFFVPIHKQPVFARRMRKLSFPVSDELSTRGLNLPSSIDLSENEVKDVATAVRSGLRKLMAS